MKFGIITGAERKRLFKTPRIVGAVVLDRPSKQNSVPRATGDGRPYTVPAEFITAELPYTLAQMQTVSEAKLQKAMAKAIRRLEKSGVSRAVITGGLKKIYDVNIATKTFKVYSGGDMLFDFARQAVLWICEKYGFDPLEIKINIREDNLSHITRRLIDSLCYDCRSMSLTTADTARAQALAKDTLERYGLMIEVLPSLLPPALRATSLKEGGKAGAVISGNAEITVDVDGRRIVSKNCVIDGPELDVEINHEDVDIFDVLTCLGIKYDEVGVLNWKNA